MSPGARVLGVLAACLALGCSSFVRSVGESLVDDRVMLRTSRTEGKRAIRWTKYWYPEIKTYIKEHGTPEYLVYDKYQDADSLHTLYHLVYVRKDRLVTWDQPKRAFSTPPGSFLELEELPPWILGLLSERDVVLKARAERAAERERALAEPEPKERYGSGYARRLALVIGIDAYRDFPDLEGGASDAHAVADALHARGFDRVVELYDGEATRGAILKALGPESPLAIGSEDMLLIYFAGHGATETLPQAGLRGYIVPVDGRPDALADSGISMQMLREIAGRLPAKHVLYALDSCFSGLGLARGLPPLRPQNYYQKMTSLRAVQVATAGREGEKAFEQDGRGVFTLFLLRALQGEADVDHDGFVTGSELGAYLPSRVSAVTQGRQTPRYGTLLGSGDVAFDVQP